MNGQGGSTLSQGTLGRVVVMLVGFVGLAMLALIGGLLYLAVTHDGEATIVVISTITGLVGFVTGLIPTILHLVNQAAGATATSSTTVNNVAPALPPPPTGPQANP